MAGDDGEGTSTSRPETATSEATQEPEAEEALSEVPADQGANDDVSGQDTETIDRGEELGAQVGSKPGTPASADAESDEPEVEAAEEGGTLSEDEAPADEEAEDIAQEPVDEPVEAVEPEDAADAVAVIAAIKSTHPGNRMAKHFDVDYYTSLDEVEQADLLRVCRSGTDNPDSGMGCCKCAEGTYPLRLHDGCGVQMRCSRRITTVSSHSSAKCWLTTTTWRWMLPTPTTGTYQGWLASLKMASSTWLRWVYPHSPCGCGWVATSPTFRCPEP